MSNLSPVLGLIVFALVVCTTSAHAKAHEKSKGEFKANYAKEYQDAYRAQYLKLTGGYYKSENEVEKTSTVQNFLARAEQVLKGWTQAPTLKKLMVQVRSAIGIRTVVPSTPVIFYTLNTSGTLPVVGLRMAPIEDPDAQLNRLVWEFGDDTSVTIPAQEFASNPSLEMQHVYPANGRYTVKLRLYDHADNYTEKQMYIWSRNNKVPVPKFDFQVGAGGDPLRVDFQSLATDVDGTVGHYYWIFGDGAGQDGPALSTVSHTYSVPGVYDVIAAASDDDQGAKFISTKIYVGVPSPENRKAPVSVSRISKSYGQAPLTVAFNASDSYSIDGSIASVEWDFGDFSSPFNFSRNTGVQYTFRRPGTYFGSLKVKDDKGLEAIEYFAIHVVDSNITEAPEIFAYNRGGRSFQLEGNPSAIRVPSIPGYTFWDFGDGYFARGPFASHDYANDGTFNVGLKVYDLRGGVTTVQKSVTVTSNSIPPVAQFRVNSMGGGTSSFVFLSQQIDQIDPTTQALWDFGDGVKQAGLHQSLLNVTHTYAAAGVYSATLTTTTADGVSSTYTQPVVVTPAGVDIRSVMKLSSTVGEIPLPVRFDGKSSSSTAGPISKYFWTIFHEDGPQRLYNPLFIQTYHTGGTKHVQLAVLDSVGNAAITYDSITAIDPIQIPGTNQPPVARINISFPNPNDPGIFRFEAGNSFDPDGDNIVQYRWILDSEEINEPYSSINRRIERIGTHVMGLRVTDKWGAIGETKLVFTRGYTHELLVDFKFGPPRPVAGSMVTFLADEETIFIPGAITRDFQWEFGDGQTGCCAGRVSHIYSAPGTYEVKFKVKDSNNQWHEASHNIVIEAEEGPTAVIQAIGVDGILQGRSGDTVTWGKFPLRIDFNLKLSSYQSSLVDATWDFGDGNTGFGLTPSWTYQKPGNYLVQATVVDAKGNQGSASINIVVGSEGCTEDGSDGCLNLVSSNQNILPLSLTSWTVKHDQGEIDWLVNPSESGWITLTSTDENATVVDISDITTAVGTELTISRDGLVAKNVDLTKSYHVGLSTGLVPDQEFSGEWPKVHFGIGRALINSNETNVKMTISGTASGYKKYVDLGSNTAVEIGDLPADTYLISAFKQGRQGSYQFTITSTDEVEVVLDLSAQTVSPVGGGVADQPTSQALESFDNSSRYLTEARADLNESTRPASCLTEPNWPIRVQRPPSPGKMYTDSFGSGGMASWAGGSYKRVTQRFGDKLKLSCLIRSNALMAELYHFNTVQIYKNCGLEPRYDLYNAFQAAAQTIGSKKLKVNYTFRDRITHQTKSGFYETSAHQAARERGIGNDFRGLIWQIGNNWVDRIVPYNYWGLPFKHDIEIPNEFIDPEVSLSFESYHRVVEEGTPLLDMDYHVTCEFETTEVVGPVLTKLVKVKDIPVSLTLNPGCGPAMAGKDKCAPTAVENGASMLVKDLLPLTADSTTAAHSYSSDLNFADIGVRILRGDKEFYDITHIKMRFSLSPSGGPYFGEKDYPILDREFANEDGKPGSEVMYATIRYDVAQLGYSFAYNPDWKRIFVEFMPFGPELSLGEVAGIQEPFHPMWNTKLIPRTDFCVNGFYNDPNIVAYARQELIEEIKNVFVSNPLARFSCNDMSLPFGARFFMWGTPEEGWLHDTHDNGLTLDARYFNESAQRQNAYDFDHAAERRADVVRFLEFSEQSKLIASSQQNIPPEVESKYWKAKKDIYNHCVENPGDILCFDIFDENDLTFEKILNLCQVREKLPPAIDLEIEGCNLDGIRYLTNIKTLSKWVERNSNAMSFISKRSEMIMSDGTRSPRLGRVGYDGKWQLNLVNKGLWPNKLSEGETNNGFIYKVNPDSGKLEQSPVPGCISEGNCGLELAFKEKKSHYNHFHMNLERK